LGIPVSAPEATGDALSSLEKTIVYWQDMAEREAENIPNFNKNFHAQQ
jgi:hypothetical protein